MQTVVGSSRIIRLFALASYYPPFQQGDGDGAHRDPPRAPTSPDCSVGLVDGGTEISAVEADGDAGVYSIDHASVDDSSLRPAFAGGAMGRIGRSRGPVPQVTSEASTTLAGSW